jgi:hypothetical protein
VNYFANKDCTRRVKFEVRVHDFENDKPISGALIEAFALVDKDGRF